MNKKGFSLVELIITIVLIAILSMVCITAYRKHMERSVEAEAKMMLGELHKAQQVYYIRNKQFLKDSEVSSETSNNNLLGVDFRKNKYFTAFKVVSTN